MEREYGSDYTMPTWAIILWCIIVLLQIIGMWKVFVKAGKPGWGCIIPIYNVYLMCKIGGKPGWWALLCLLIPFFIIWVYNMISKSFGKDEGFTAGLFFLGPIFWPILGFGNAKYLGPYGDPAAFQAHQGKGNFDFENKQQL
ncbi:MAG TPA: DUF5684 domain-containing protein [Chitinophagaceae bacterium]|nr:DUF5684 domain-containing protein [Chitinophagaceae bacterium]